MRASSLSLYRRELASASGGKRAVSGRREAGLSLPSKPTEVLAANVAVGKVPRGTKVPLGTGWVPPAMRGPVPLFAALRTVFQFQSAPGTGAAEPTQRKKLKSLTIWRFSPGRSRRSREGQWEGPAGRTAPSPIAAPPNAEVAGARGIHQKVRLVTPDRGSGLPQFVFVEFLPF